MKLLVWFLRFLRPPHRPPYDPYVAKQVNQAVEQERHGDNWFPR